MATPGRTTYLDHAATTPVLPAAAAVLTDHLGLVGNPSSLHGSGRRARQVVEEAREVVADALGCRPGEVVFTSGGTESDNLAVKGLFWGRRAEDPRRTRILATAVEHHAVLDPLDWLSTGTGPGERARVELLPVDAAGRLEVEALREALERDPGSVALVTAMWANNEVGTRQPVEEVVALAAAHGVPVHSDAVQAVGALPVDLGAVPVDALTLSGHKLGGPHGVGALVARRDLPVVPLVHGGGQERDVRSGTLDVPAVAALATAVEAAVAGQAEHAARVRALRDRLVAGVRARVPDARVNGAPGDGLPGLAHLTFPGCEGDSLLMLLDAQGIECSTGSACQAGVPQPSHVLLAMGHDEVAARSALRFSLGRTSTDDDVDALLAAIGPVVERARAAGSRGRPAGSGGAS